MRNFAFFLVYGAIAFLGLCWVLTWTHHTINHTVWMIGNVAGVLGLVLLAMTWVGSMLGGSKPYHT